LKNNVSVDLFKKIFCSIIFEKIKYKATNFYFDINFSYYRFSNTYDDNLLRIGLLLT